MRHSHISWAFILLTAILFPAQFLLAAVQTPTPTSGESSPAAAQADSSTGSNMVSSVTATEFARAVASLQAEWKATRESVEALRHRAEQDSRQSQDRMGEQLARLEKRIDSQHEDRDQILRAMEVSSTQNARLASMFVGIGLVALFAMSYVQWRAMVRLTQLATRFSSDRLELGAHVATSPDARVAATKETTRLIESLERLEHRIEDFETVVSRPGEVSAKPGALAAPPDEATQMSPAAEVPSVEVLLASAQVSIGFSPEAPKSETNTPAAEPVLMPSESGNSPTSVSRSPSVSALLAKGEALLQLGQSHDALKAFEELLSHEPNHVEAWVKKGSALERLDQVEQALACYDRAITTDATFTLAYLYKGGICNRLERFDDALACYEQALRSHETAAAS